MLKKEINYYGDMFERGDHTWQLINTLWVLNMIHIPHQWAFRHAVTISGLMREV